jgi:hypothetical protein
MENQQTQPEFIKRIMNPQDYPVLWNNDGSFSTHEMAVEVDDQGNWFTFPTIVMLPSGELYRFEDPYQALEYNQRTGNFLQFDSKDKALKYAEGGYKKGTPLFSFKPVKPK